MALQLLPQEDSPKIKSKALDLVETESKGSTNSNLNMGLSQSSSFGSKGNDSNFLKMEKKTADTSLDEPLALFEFKKSESKEKNDKTNVSSTLSSENKNLDWDKASSQASKFDIENVSSKDIDQSVDFKVASDHPQSVDLHVKPVGNRKSWDEVQTASQFFDLDVKEPVQNLETSLDINHTQTVDIKVKPVGNRKSWDEVKPLNNFFGNTTSESSIDLEVNQTQTVEIKTKPIGNRKSWDDVKPMSQMAFQQPNQSFEEPEVQPISKKIQPKIEESKPEIKVETSITKPTEVTEEKIKEIIKPISNETSIDFFSSSLEEEPKPTIQTSSTTETYSSFEDALGSFESSEILQPIENKQVIQSNEASIDFFGLGESTSEPVISEQPKPLTSPADIDSMFGDLFTASETPVAEEPISPSRIEINLDDSEQLFGHLSTSVEEKLMTQTDNVSVEIIETPPIQEKEESQISLSIESPVESKSDEIDIKTESSSSIGIELVVEEKLAEEIKESTLSLEKESDLSIVQNTEEISIKNEPQIEIVETSKLSLEKTESVEETTQDISSENQKPIEEISNEIDQKNIETKTEKVDIAKVENSVEEKSVEESTSTKSQQQVDKLSFIDKIKAKLKKENPAKIDKKPEASQQPEEMKESFLTRLKSTLNSDVPLNFTLQDLGKAEFYEKLSERVDHLFQKTKKNQFLAMEILPNKINYMNIFQYENTDAKPLVHLYGSIPIDGKPAEAIKKLKEIKAERFHISTVMPRELFLMTIIDQPLNIPIKELPEMARWKIKDMIDYSPTEATIDILEIYPDPSLPPKNLQMFAIIANNKNIENLMDQYEKFKLQLEVIDIPQLAQRNIASLVCDPNKGVAFLSITPYGTLLTITKNNEIYSQSAMDSITLNALLSAEKEDQRLMLFDRLVLDLQRRLDTFERQFSYVQISKLVLSPLPESIQLEKHLAENLYLKVEQFNFKDYIDFGAYADTFSDVSLQSELFFMIGASLRKLSKSK